MPEVYSVYGLRVLADSRVPGLAPYGESERIDVRIRLNRLPEWWDDRVLETAEVWFLSPARASDGKPSLTVWKLQREGWYRLLYADDTEFVVNPNGGEIWCRWPANATLEDTTPYLIGPVMGFTLRLREVCCLHASAVTVGQKTLAFVGPPKAGKSTTAAAFATLGYAVVSDDIVTLIERDGRFVVRPGYPRLCLWPDAGNSLYGESRSLPRISPEGGINDWWDKRYVDLNPGEQQFQVESLPLSAIYLLDPRQDEPDCPKVEPIARGPAMVRLVGNTYMNYLLDRDLRSKEFQILSRVITEVPVRRVVPHTDPARLTRLCETILADHSSLPVPSGTPRDCQSLESLSQT